MINNEVHNSGTVNSTWTVTYHNEIHLTVSGIYLSYAQFLPE